MIVDFTFTTSGTTVKFQNLSENVPGVKYSWNFGDGNTSCDKNPVHKYSCSGNYSVSLEVSDVVSGKVLGISTEEILATDFVKTHLSCSIYHLIDTYIPQDIFGYIPGRIKKQFIEKWQLYLQPLVNHCIPVEEYNNELYYEALENQLIMELAAYDYMVLQVNLAIQAGVNVIKENNSHSGGETCDPDRKVTIDEIYGNSSSETSSNTKPASAGRIKKIQTGPSEVEYFDDADSESSTLDNAIKALKPGGILDLTKGNICMLASRLDIYLPICQRLNSHRVVPRVVNRRDPGFLGGPDPLETLQ